MKIQKFLKPKKLSAMLQHPVASSKFAFWKLSIIINKTKRNNYKKEIALLSTSGFFDSKFYLEKYPDVKKYGPGPVKHYYFHGYREGRQPHANFNEKFFSSLRTKIHE